MRWACWACRARRRVAAGAVPPRWRSPGRGSAAAGQPLHAHPRAASPTCTPPAPRSPAPRSHGPPNDQVYTALLTLIQRQALQERAVDVWTAIKADGVRQSPHLLSALFAACTTDAPSPALVDTAVEAARAAQGAWRAAAARGAPSAWAERDWLVAFNALLHFLGSVRALPRALAVYRGMVRRRPTFCSFDLGRRLLLLLLLLLLVSGAGCARRLCCSLLRAPLIACAPRLPVCTPTTLRRCGAGPPRIPSPTTRCWRRRRRAAATCGPPCRSSPTW